MYRYPDGTIKRTLPATINANGVIRYSKDMTAELLDAVGYNVALRMDRDPCYVYETKWVKDGLTYQETAVSAVLDEAAQTAAADAAILAQIVALEALLTERLKLEAFLGLTCTVNNAGCCIHGLTPAAAMAHINTELEALRAQLTKAVSYQVE